MKKTLKSNSLSRLAGAVLSTTLCAVSLFVGVKTAALPVHAAESLCSQGDTSGAFEITSEGQYIVHADHWSREDFSRQANPSVFTGVFTRELYNAIRQTLIDGEPGEQPAFTVVPSDKWNTVKRMLSNLSGGVFFYEKFAPQNFIDRYKHPGYFALSVRMPENRKVPLEFIPPVMEHINTLASTREKVTYLNDYLCSLLAYDYENYHPVGVDEIFSSHPEEARGTCASYCYAMQFLCEAADIPCIGIESREGNHVWNMVYADGQWLYVDATYNDAANNSVLLVKNHPDYSDSYPEATAFLQELLVPGSTVE